METRASPFVVGLFTLIVLATTFGILYWIGAYGDTSGRVQYRVIFSDEVTGLSKGSNVLYNGIKAGEVLDLSVAKDDPAQIVALIQVDPKIPINVDTTAQMQYQGITGVAFVQLKTAKPDAKPLTEAWGDSKEPPIIYAEKSAFQDLLEGAQSIMAKVDSVVEQIDVMIKDNSTSITTTVHNVETVSTALAANADKISTFISDASSAARQITVVGAKIDTLATNLNKVVEAVDPAQVRGIVSDARDMVADARNAVARFDSVAETVDTLVRDNGPAVTASIENIRTFSGALAANSDKISSFMADASSAAQRINEVGGKIDTLATNLNKVVEAVDPAQVSGIISDARDTVAAARSAVERFDTVAENVDTLVRENGPAVTASIESIRTFSGALAENSDKIPAFMADAASAAQRINEVSARVDTLVANVNKVVEVIQPDEVRAIVADVRTFADTLAANSDRITVLAENAGQAAERINGIAQRFSGIADDVGKVVKAVDPAAISQAVANIDRITATIAGKDQEISKFIDDATATAASLRDASQRINALLEKVDGMVGSDGGKNVIANVSEAAQSFKKLADNLNARLDVITADIQRYGVGGLKDFQAFMSEGRRTLSTIDRTLNNLESNPAGFLTGRSSVPEYNPGRRF
jgi:phospholipid/cholesterol/gamma-HCH transport system substrate-binding protein